MRKLWILWKLNFRTMLRAFSMGRGKKAAGGIGALALMAFLALYCSGVYSFMLAGILSGAGLVDLVLPLMAAVACLMSCMLTVTAASGLVFGGRDSDFMLTLPVPAFTVVLGKVLALYLENFVFCGLWMIPTSIAYLTNASLGAGGAVWFCVRAVIVLPFLPLLPAAVGLVCGWLIAYASGRMRHKTLVSTLLSIVFIGAVMVGSFQLNGLSALLLEHADSVRRTLHTWLYPFGLLLDGLTGSAGALLLFALFTLLPFLALTWLVGTRYRRILSAVGSHRTRADYQLRGVKTSGAFAALFQKECRRYFGTTAYFLNTGIGALMLLGFSAYVVFSRDKTQAIIALFGGAQAAAPLFAVLICLMEATVNTACVSISLEGKTLWILKEAPVRAQTLFGAKALLGALMAGVPAAVSTLLMAAGTGIPLMETASVLALVAAMSLFIPVFGLSINLRFPKMDSENDTIVVKQSAAAMLGSFGGMGVVGLGALLWAAVGRWVPFAAFSLLAALLLCAAAALLWHWLCRRGISILQTL